MHPKIICRWCGTMLLLCAGLPIGGAEPELAAPPWLDPSGIRGSLVIVGGGSMADEIRHRFVELAGGKAARLVLIPTASETAEPTLADPKRLSLYLEPWKALGVADIQVLHTRSRETANEVAFSEPIKRATGIWFGGGDQSKIADAYLGTAVEREITALLSRGGVVGGTSAGAAIQSKVMIAGGRTQPLIGVGFDLLPSAIIDQHFVARQRKERLIAAVHANPACVGYGIDEGTALIVRGRKLEAIGKSTVTVVLAASPGRPLRELELKNGERHDLTMLRRAALERSLGNFPPAKPALPEVNGGALVIVGGGTLPREITEKFIELAGGPDAPIVVLPIAAGDTLTGDTANDTRLFDRAGAKHVKSLRARTRAETEDVAFLEALKNAKGVWFGGGRQWRFVDAYANTPVEGLLRDVLKRGGVIGGSSAGASIQGQYMPRGSALGNEEMMAEGYERGLGFLPGVAIDQHFTQRKRQGDMTALMSRYPQLLGIGIDEGTALIVQGQRGDVLGKNGVHFYDYRSGPPPGERDYALLKAGQRFDLALRKVMD